MKYTAEQLKEILVKHHKWVFGETGGERADLSYADLSNADLSYANLSYADLSYADLSYANLSYADLSYADLSSADLSYANLRSANLSSADLSYANLRSANLRSADLSSANLRSANLSYANLSSADLRKTSLEGINWLAYIGIVSVNGKARAYKVVKSTGEGMCYSGINYLESKIVEGDSFDSDDNKLCSHGVNLATLQWCFNNKSASSYRLLLMEFKVTPDNVCCPIGSDGKFRVKTATRIGECDWQGNLLEGVK